MNQISSVVKLHASLQCLPFMSELRCHLQSTAIFLQVISGVCYSYMPRVICCLFVLCMYPIWWSWR